MTGTGGWALLLSKRALRRAVAADRLEHTMSQPLNEPRGPAPQWLVVGGSVAIVCHLLAVGAVVLAAPSGLWFVPQIGPTMAEPPTFAVAVNNVTGPNYLQPIKLANDYHFMSNRTMQPGVELEARLKFKDGTEKVLKFPDKDTNPWVRHRQSLLVRGLGDDRPVPLDPTKGVALVTEKVKKRMISYWEASPQDPVLRLKTVPEDLIPRDRGEVLRPSEWSLLLAQSYARYLCRTYGAESVELVRYHQDTIRPDVMLWPRPPQSFPVMKANFGEFSR